MAVARRVVTKSSGLVRIAAQFVTKIGVVRYLLRRVAALRGGVQTLMLIL